MIAVPAYELIQLAMAKSNEVAGSDSSNPDAPAVTPVDAQAVQASREQANYISKSLKVYDLRARYYDSMLDGRVPGVDFKIKNNGNRTLNSVTVRVVFQDKNGNPIAEEEYYPVLVTSSGIGDNNTPLRPNYIWQQESGQFYAAKKVPNEWEPGRATATITEIEFADAKE
jgi:hypothetical protein